MNTIAQHIQRWVKLKNPSLFADAVFDLTRSKSEPMLENAFLRQQLIVLNRQVIRPAIKPRERVFLVVLASGLRSWKQALAIVQPDTLLRWHRDLYRWLWKRKSRMRKQPGRPPLSEEIVALIQRMARENRTWGAKRIRGELLKLGLHAAKSTIQRYIKQIRGPGSSQQTWRTFIHNHVSEIWACDILQTHNLFFRAFFVFVIIELRKRRIVHIGVTRHPTDRWLAQQFREATPFGAGPRFLIRDNDHKLGASFACVAIGTGIDVLRKLCFIDLEHTRRLVIPNVLTRDYERMVIFGHYSFASSGPIPGSCTKDSESAVFGSTRNSLSSVIFSLPQCEDLLQESRSSSQRHKILSCS